MQEKTGSIVWAKALIRYYPDISKAPHKNNEKCLADKERILSEANPKLLLRDGTMLVGAPEAVIRIDLLDGSTRAKLPPTIGVFDAADVIKTKLEMTKKEAGIIRKCLQEGEDPMVSAKCGQFRIQKFGVVDENDLELSLAARIFKNKH